MIIVSIKEGFKKAVMTTWILTKIIVPVFFFVTIIKHTPIIDFISEAFKPFMSWFSLPGESVIILVVGALLDPYSAIGAIKAMEDSLSTHNITTLAIMVCFCHSLIIESALIRKLKLNIFILSGTRILMAIIFGVLIGKVGGYFL